MIQENRNRLRCASKTGCISDGEGACFARIVCAVGLQIIADIMLRTWAFAVGSDVATDDFGHYDLDVRVRFPGIDAGDDLLSFHLPAMTLSSARSSKLCVRPGKEELLALHLRLLLVLIVLSIVSGVSHIN